MTAPSLLILGTDVVLAATPATPVQLAHACLAAGYDAVIPASWGDELIAAHVLDRLKDTVSPVVQCTCPLVAQRIAAQGSGLEPMLVRAVAPPVAAAQYLRALYSPVRPEITFAGGCAAMGHEAIDMWLTPEALFARLADRGIATLEQPTEFDAVLSPDRRRFFSDPGGVPSVAALRRLPRAIERRDLEADDLGVEIGQALLSSFRSLIDVAPAVGCACSGATDSVRADIARARVRELEPPRSFAPVVDHSIPLALATDPAAALAAASAPNLAGPPPAPPALPASESLPLPEGQESAPKGGAVVPEPRRKTPQGLPRPALATMPHARTNGRQLPRAYIARRRSSPRSVRQVPESAARPPEDAKPPKMNWIPIVAAGLTAGLILSWLILAI